MYRMVNLPSKASKQDICGVATENSYRIQTSECWEICTIGKHTDAYLAREIADAIRLARDIGYEQAQKDMRKQLGVKE